jgi:tetratricopeptide (TPR) repeat protein
MRSTKIPHLCVVALLVLSFGLAARLDVWFQSWEGSRTQSVDALNVLLGDSRRMFANHFYTKADAYFHSGYYPTIYDNNEAFRTKHMAEDTGAVASKNHGDEERFLGKKRDWIDAFSRSFFPSRHTHLDEGGPQGDLGDKSEVREILPWLRLSAELDPSNVQTYTVTAYWLRNRMHKVNEAEEFLREGLRANSDSPEILFELGRIAADNRNNPEHAVNLWELALSDWRKQAETNSDPDKVLFIQITSRLTMTEESRSNYDKALTYAEMWKSQSPAPAEIQERIDELRKKIAAGKTGPSSLK